MPSRSSTRCCDTSFSDVPVGTLLSGGVDSTAMLCLAAEASEKPTASFTIGFDGGGVVDERSYARLAAKQFGTEHYETTISAGCFRDFLPGYVHHMEETSSCAARTGSSCSTSASKDARRARRSSGRRPASRFPTRAGSATSFGRSCASCCWATRRGSEAASDREPPRASWIATRPGPDTPKSSSPQENARRAPRSGLPQRFAPSFS